jgi:hypothetical protein
VKDHLRRMTYEIELAPGEKLRLLEPLVSTIGPAVGGSPFSQCVNRRRGVTVPPSPATLPKTKGCIMTIQSGEFRLADIPFRSVSASKKQTVLVLRLKALGTVVVANAPPMPGADRSYTTFRWDGCGSWPIES